MGRIRYGNRIFDMVNSLLMIFIGIITLYPFLNVLAVSLNDSLDTVRGGITFYPRVFTLASYKEIFEYPALLTGFFNSILRTTIGTALGLLCTAMLAYTLSREDYFARKFITIMATVTIYAGGGLIPDYMLIRSLGLFGTFSVYIVPSLIGAFNVIVIRSFIDGLPFDLQESARLDGANDLQIFFGIILPMCLPVLATVSLFIAVGQWNSWFDNYLYNNGKPYLTTLQFELQKVLLASSVRSSSGQNPFSQMDPIRHLTITPESIRMAITIVATVPIFLMYPMIQKYFITGITVGTVKV